MSRLTWGVGGSSAPEFGLQAEGVKVQGFRSEGFRGTLVGRLRILGFELFRALGLWVVRGSA